MKLYLAGPMRGYPFFNFPAFHEAAAVLRNQGHTIFSPAERDEAINGEDFAKRFPTGSNDDAAAQGFDLRAALCDDLTWVCREADGIALLPGWEKSRGARAEKATAEALDLKVFFLSPEHKLVSE
jgi:uncharacterized protein DUF4406